MTHFKKIKSLCLLICFCLAYFSQVEASEKQVEASEKIESQSKHLVLHFDVNQTLITFDSEGKKTTKDNINHLLANQYLHYWSEDQKEEMTYADYIHNVLLQGDCRDTKLKKQRKLYLNNFSSFLEQTKHPLAKKIRQDFLQILQKINSSKKIVFQSFYDLLSFLEKNNISYSIHLRSFGSDSKRVAKEIEEHLGHSFFDECVFFKKGKLYSKGKVMTDSKQIYQFFSSKRNLVVRDDWSWWDASGRKTEYGKPFYINENDSNFLHIFFDDNVGRSWGNPQSQGIVCPINIKTTQCYPINQAIKEKRLNKADTFKAILEDDYYIKKLAEALEKQDMSRPFCIESTR